MPRGVSSRCPTASPTSRRQTSTTGVPPPKSVEFIPRKFSWRNPFGTGSTQSGRGSYEPLWKDQNAGSPRSAGAAIA